MDEFLILVLIGELTTCLKLKFLPLESSKAWSKSSLKMIVRGLIAWLLHWLCTKLQINKLISLKEEEEEEEDTTF